MLKKRKRMKTNNNNNIIIDNFCIALFSGVPKLIALKKKKKKKKKKGRNVPLVEFMYPVFIRIPGESYRKAIQVCCCAYVRRLSSDN